MVFAKSGPHEKIPSLKLHIITWRAWLLEQIVTESEKVLEVLSSQYSISSPRAARTNEYMYRNEHEPP